MKDEYIKETKNYIHYRMSDGIRFHDENYVKWLEEKNNNTHCSCSEEEKTGETSIMCCNRCGKPTEKFWYSKNKAK